MGGQAGGHFMRYQFISITFGMGVYQNGSIGTNSGSWVKTNNFLKIHKNGLWVCITLFRTPMGLLTN